MHAGDIDRDGRAGNCVHRAEQGRDGCGATGDDGEGGSSDRGIDTGDATDRQDLENDGQGERRDFVVFHTAIGIREVVRAHGAVGRIAVLAG